MAKKAARRNGGRTSMTVSQKKRRKRLQHFNFEAKLARRTNIAGWDEKATLKSNYRKLGIAFDANAILSKPNEAFEDPAHQLVPEKTGIMTDRLVYLQSLPAPTPYEVKSMNVQEQYQLQRLIAAHGDNYEAMQMDLKLNINQVTAHKLQKRIELMFRLQNATNSSGPSKNQDDEEFDDEDFEDEDFDDEDMEDEDMEEEEEEAVDADLTVPKVDTTGLSELEAIRAEGKRKRIVQRINTINHNKEVNQRFKSGLKDSKFGSKIVVPGLTQLINTRGTKKRED